MRLYLRLAWRNLWRHKRRTLIVVIAIAFCMALMMWYDGLIVGFKDAIYGNAIKILGGNVQVHAAGYTAKAGEKPLLPIANDQAVVQTALNQPQVVAASRRIETGGLASNHKGAFAVSIIGIEPEKEAPVNLVAQNIGTGRYLTTADQDVVFIGRGLAEEMDVKPGDRITLVGRGVHDQMRRRTMTVVGTYDVGMRELEKRSIYISLAEAQELYGLSGQITEVAITLKRIGDEPAVMNALKGSHAGIEVASWQTSFPELEAAIETKGGVMNIFSVIILIIAGIGILNLLLMAVYERTREIGVLGALGMRPGEISTLFLLEGGLMGLVGLAAGVLLGLALNTWLGQVGLDFAQFSGITDYMALITGRIYPTLGLEKLPSRALTTLIIAILSAFYPAREAARSEPAKALHFV